MAASSSHIIARRALSRLLILTALATYDALAISAAEEAFSAMDVDKSGRVEEADVDRFASAQGLNLAQARKEFKELDLNGDSELDQREIGSSLSEPRAYSAPANAMATARTNEDAGAVSMSPAASMAQASMVQVPVTPPSGPQAALLQAPVAQASGIVTPAVTPPLSAAALSSSPASSQSSLASSALEALEVEVSRHTGKAMAESFMRSAAKALETRDADNAQAAQLETKAQQLRSKSAEMRKQAAMLTTHAAKTAAHEVLRTTADKVHSLEREAVQDEHEAGVRREQANAALTRALQAQATMSATVHDLASKAAA